MGHKTCLESGQITQTTMFHASIAYSPTTLHKPSNMVTLDILKTTFGSSWEPTCTTLNKFEQACKDQWGLVLRSPVSDSESASSCRVWSCLWCTMLMYSPERRGGTRNVRYHVWPVWLRWQLGIYQFCAVHVELIYIGLDVPCTSVVTRGWKETTSSDLQCTYVCLNYAASRRAPSFDLGPICIAVFLFLLVNQGNCMWRKNISVQYRWESLAMKEARSKISSPTAYRKLRLEFELHDQCSQMWQRSNCTWYTKKVFLLSQIHQCHHSMNSCTLDAPIRCSDIWTLSEWAISASSNVTKFIIVKTNLVYVKRHLYASGPWGCNNKIALSDNEGVGVLMTVS